VAHFLAQCAFLTTATNSYVETQTGQHKYNIKPPAKHFCRKYHGN